MLFSSQQVDFNTTFYSSPAVLVSFHHYYNRQANHLGVPQESNIITAWVEVRNSPLLSCMFSNNNVDIHVWIRELACSKSIRVTWLEESFISRLGHGKNCLKIWLFCRKLISYPWGFASKTWVEQELNTNLCLLATLWLEVTINDCLPSGTCKKVFQWLLMEDTWLSKSFIRCFDQLNGLSWKWLRLIPSMEYNICTVLYSVS